MLNTESPHTTMPHAGPDPCGEAAVSKFFIHDKGDCSSSLLNRDCPGTATLGAPQTARFRQHCKAQTSGGDIATVVCERTRARARACVCCIQRDSSSNVITHLLAATQQRGYPSSDSSPWSRRVAFARSGSWPAWLAPITARCGRAPERRPSGIAIGPPPPPYTDSIGGPGRGGDAAPGPGDQKRG